MLSLPTHSNSHTRQTTVIIVREDFIGCHPPKAINDRLRMTAYETYSDISSTLDFQDLSTIDESEARGILTSLGKRYYMSAGMGKSLEIDKLRQLQGEYSR